MSSPKWEKILEPINIDDMRQIPIKLVNDILAQGDKTEMSLKTWIDKLFVRIKSLTPGRYWIILSIGKRWSDWTIVGPEKIETSKSEIE